MLKRHPGLLSQPVELQTKTRIATVPYSRLPNAIRNDLNAWVRITPIKVKNGPNLAGALAEKTIENYIDSTRTILAVVMLATKEPLDDAVDIALLAQPIAVRCWLPVLDGLSEPTTVCGHLAGLLRMMRDLPDRSQDDIEYLEARQSERMRTPEIDADQRAMVARWEEPALHACLLAAPETLMRIAEDASEGMRTRVLAGASAFAFHLMWEHPSLSQWAIVNFDLVDHVQGEPGARVVLHEIPASGAQPARWLATPVSPEGEATWERLLGSRRQMSVLSTLLLPGEDGLARETSAGMEVIYNKIQEVLGERLVATDFRDLNKSLVVPDPEADLDEAAAAFGINRRALERRFAADLQSRYRGPRHERLAPSPARNDRGHPAAAGGRSRPRPVSRHGGARLAQAHPYPGWEHRMRDLLRTSSLSDRDPNPSGWAATAMRKTVNAMRAVLQTAITAGLPCADFADLQAPEVLDALERRLILKRSARSPCLVETQHALPGGKTPLPRTWNGVSLAGNMSSLQTCLHAMRIASSPDLKARIKFYKKSERQSCNDRLFHKETYMRAAAALDAFGRIAQAAGHERGGRLGPRCRVAGGRHRRIPAPRRTRQVRPDARRAQPVRGKAADPAVHQGRHIQGQTAPHPLAAAFDRHPPHGRPAGPAATSCSGVPMGEPTRFRRSTACCGR